MRVTFAASVTSVREINAAEEAVGSYQAQSGNLVVDLNPYQPRSFAVRIAPAPAKIAALMGTGVTLPYDLDGISLHADLKDGSFDETGQTYPGELWPTQVTSDGITFRLGSSAPGVKKHGDLSRTDHQTSHGPP